MIFLKCSVLLGIIGICTYLGILKAKTYENRVKQLNLFQNSLVMFKTKLNFTHKPIKDIFEEISNLIYKGKENIFKSTIENDDDIFTNWSCAVYNIKSDLSKQDKKIIEMMGKLLGKTDISGQINEIELTSTLIEKQLKDAENEKNKNVKLYKTMGIVIGIGICIILI